MSKSTAIYTLILTLVLSACIDRSKIQIENEGQIKTTETNLTPDQEEVKATVERFLVVVGNHDLDAVDEMISDKANIGIRRNKDGEWESTIITIAEYLESARSRQLKPYYEPVIEWDIHINEGQIAFVKADAIVHSYGVPRARDINYFTLIKENEEWIFLNLSFTANPFPEDKRKFSLEAFAKSYAQAWSGVRPEFVSNYFTEDGSLQVNDGTPAQGRTEIAKIAQGFMTDLPDMIVRFDSLDQKSNGTQFHWTLTATNSGPGGTGNKVHVSGFELWQMGENGLIKESKGSFPTEEYNRQLQYGIDN